MGKLIRIEIELTDEDEDNYFANISASGAAISLVSDGWRAQVTKAEWVEEAKDALDNSKTE